MPENRILVACSPIMTQRPAWSRHHLWTLSLLRMLYYKGHSIGIAVTPTVLTRPGTQCLWPILSSEEVVPRWKWNQTGYWVLSRIWTACRQNSVWLTSKSFKARLHQRRSNLGSTEPHSPMNGDLNRVRVAFCCTNFNLVQLTVDQLIGDLNRGYNVDNADWL